jgi:hypothetical protein
MSLKEVYSPKHGRNVKFGRTRPAASGPNLKLSRYLLAATLPTPPASVDYTGPSLSALRNIDDNDTLGDCVIACGAHLVATETGNAGALYSATSAQIIKQYSDVGGYIPGVPSSDQGCNISTALTYWQKTGLVDGTKIAGSIVIDATNAQELKTAMWLFENLVFGIELPDSWINPFPSADGFVWDAAAPDESNGHCVLGVGYTSKGISIDSWGLFGTLTYAAIAQLCLQSANGEVHAVLSTDQLLKASQKSPNGVAWADLIRDFNALGGSVPVPPAPAPVPTPAPTPSPAPSVSVSLAQVEAWLAAGINSGMPLQTRSQAIALANAQISKNWPKS